MATQIYDASSAQECLKKLLEGSKSAVFFGGAGVSVASGIPDFRSPDGLYNQKFDYPPEEILSHSFYTAHPDIFFDFYKKKMLCPDARPNQCHIKLAELEKEGHLEAVVTQNIDGLHQKAGSKLVYELHGSTKRNYCQGCHANYSDIWMLEQEGVPTCPACGSRIKPDVVLYEEALDSATIDGAVSAIAKADVLLIGGTSLTVYPAAGLTRYFSGHTLVLINKTETAQDALADIVIRCPIESAFDF